jgi:hypothetical protein
VSGKVLKVEVRLATPEDAHIEAYDNTKLQAANTCPTWGIIRYQMHKTFASNSRAMALEAGSAMHEVFAAVRLYQLYRYDLQPTDAILAKASLEYNGRRLFGDDRFEDMLEEMNRHEDERDRYMNFCLQALYSSGFYDDPSDRRRTMTNLEEAAILYMDRWDFNRNPIWMRDPTDPRTDVGIEIPFDIVLTYTFEGGVQRNFRFVGKFDGIHRRDDAVIVGENKTASRADEAWRLSFEMSSQITGYMLAGSVWTTEQISKGIVWGSVLPVPKAYDNGLCIEHVSRKDYQFERWFDWFLHTVELYERYKHDPISAPKYTHSCNRYFRPCSMIPFCTADDEDQQAALEEMVTDEWSPLHDNKAGD